MPESSLITERTHRFALSLSGGVALGSYEAGVLCQLYRDLQDFNNHTDIQGKAKIAIDCIAGASAGSITGLIFAQALALNLSPDQLEKRMRSCWIEILEIHNLLTTPEGEAAGDSLFTGSVVAKIVKASLDIPPSPMAPETEPIALWVTMTNLDGIPNIIDFERKYHAQASTDFLALSFRDYLPFLIEGSHIRMIEDRMDVQSSTSDTPPSSEAGWMAAVEAVRASSAFPVAFPSRYQQRNLDNYPEYAAFKQAVEMDERGSSAGQVLQSVKNSLPDKAWFQFVDGGLFNNQPIGQAINAVEYLNHKYPERDPYNAASGGKVGRSYLLIEPDPQLGANLEHAVSANAKPPETPPLPPTVMGKIFGAYFNNALNEDFRTVANTNAKIESLDRTLDKLDSLGLETAKLAELKHEIKRSVGLHDKTQITLQRIPHRVKPSKRLACGFGGHFGGFLRQDYREADFITGRSEAREWFAEWLLLWLQGHAEDIDKPAKEITAEYVQGLFTGAAPDPAEVQIAPTSLTPQDLANSAWFMQHDPDGQISDVDRKAALTKDQRIEILKLAEARGEKLLQSWLRHPIFIHLSVVILAHLMRHRYTDDPSD